MKTKLATFLCVMIIGFGSVSPVRADVDAPSAVADVIVVRPVCFAATIIGAALFIVSLPASLPSHSVKQTANVLVNKPAKATFKRPVGEFDEMDY